MVEEQQKRDTLERVRNLSGPNLKVELEEGGGLSSKELWEQIKELQNKIQNLQDEHEKEKLAELYIEPLFVKWEKVKEAEAQAAAAAEAAAQAAQAAQAAAAAPAEEVAPAEKVAEEVAIVYDGGRRSRRGAIKKKYKKARKSRRRVRS